MNKIKIILIIAFTIFITGCSGASPRVGAGMGMGVGIGFSGKKPPCETIYSRRNWRQVYLNFSKY